MNLFHIVARSEWEEREADALYEPPSLRLDGFIHLSTSKQLLETAQRHFSDQTDLLVLEIDRDSLIGPLRFEEAHGELYPHLYGPLEPRCVVAVVALPRLTDGSFVLPSEWAPRSEYFC